MEYIFLYLVAAFGSSVLITALIRTYALKKSLIDIPSRRSSHSVPTPRGGGLSIVITFMASSILLYFTDSLQPAPFLSVAVSGSMVASIGFWDDHGHVSAKWRIVVHFLAAGLAMLWIGGFPPIPLGDMTIDAGWTGFLPGVILLVWFLNLYNFMDGIDGLAGTEAACVTGGAALILHARGADHLSVWLLLLCAGCAGFLVWNWPPARIFMGDAGSGFIGFTVGVIALYTSLEEYMNIWTWFILFGVFLVDATFTLTRRMLQGETWYEAHRSHAYQYASRRFGSHKKVTLAVLMINLLWLFPLAWISVFQARLAPVLLVCSWTPLILMAAVLGAGKPEEEKNSIHDFNT
ncbi:MAG TPA: glycosyltransferase family 4 protein [Thermodesulfobacteriaceae bacterium]|nr:glycosyltransferase family 4 protein [Thermodesulfobacteriaceae bacterium]